MLIRREIFMRSERKKKKSKRWLKITGIVLLLLIVGAGAYAYSRLQFIDKCSGYDAPTNRTGKNQKNEQKILR